jgi:CBS domain-containing protein
MDVGPTTVRPTESAAALLERMRARDVRAILVTSAKGAFRGIARRSDSEYLVESKRAKAYAGQDRRH